MTDRFPAGFLFGTATAAHQVEGDNRLNDWWAWEQEPGRVRNGDRSGEANDHYRRFDADFTLLQELSQNAHRLSLEWSRIEPAPGEFSAEAIEHYRRVLGSLRAHGLEPMVTMHHFTNPTWFAALGGWDNPDAPAGFARYVQRVIGELGDLAQLWVTINEPTVIAYQGYLKGDWPPGRRDLAAAGRVIGNLIRAHWLAFEQIKARSTTSQVGLAHHIRLFDAARNWAPPDQVVAAVYNRLFNQGILRALDAGRLTWFQRRFTHGSGPRHSQDFLGLNYYTRDRVRFSPRNRAEFYATRVLSAGAQRSDLGWEIYPDGMRRSLRLFTRFRLPIYVTENGIADADDHLRPAYIVDHLRAVLRAMSEGAPVRGYFHWTCFDNFEWAEGYGARFGLMDRERRIKPSGRLYAEICRTGSLPVSGPRPIARWEPESPRVQESP
jgi:beta-glucosidase